MIYTDFIMNFPLQRQMNRRFTKSIGGDDEKFKNKSSIKVLFISFFRIDFRTGSKKKSNIK